MPLRLFNSMGRKLSLFKPMKAREARMYTCGPTVWNYAHVGNFRTFLFEDVLRRYLLYKGFTVTQVMNITDVEDKIIKGMKQFHMTREELVDFYEAAFMKDLEALNIEKAEHYPRATDNIPEMVSLIKTLVRKKYAYKSEDGSYYFAVSKFKKYGALSGVRTAKLRSGARVKQDSYDKAEAYDFALWKAWDPADGDVFWETDLGKGRPGWHIECSAMSMKYLGESFDIHTGGVDNKFPHHENEIAQSEAATGKKFVKYWMHSEFLNVRGEEMHKSSGNIVTVRELLKQGWKPRAIRLFLVGGHYRESLNLTDESLAQAEANIERMDQFVRRLQGVRAGKDGGKSAKITLSFLEDFEHSMDDDLNVPLALAALFRYQRGVNSLIDAGEMSKPEADEALATLKRVDQVLGVMRFEDAASVSSGILKLIEQREEARKRKDYRRADEIRVELKNQGIIVQDTPSGPVWTREQ
ncbi:MAG: cysteine--tRNA ligase [Thaumarchaeota archaeon]|nr:cysteine--tRNA ligase [Nitrososphaerota archaeon]